MGNNCCLGFWRKDDNGGAGAAADENAALLRGRTFDVSTALVDLPPNVYVNRTAAAPPTCCLSPHMFLAVHDSLPLYCRRRKWKLLYGTEEHGFSLHSLLHQCELAAAHKLPAGVVLVVQAGGGGTFGAYLSGLPEPHRDAYCGTNESFVFRFDRERRIAVFPSARENGDPDANDYYVRIDDTSLSVGGGGRGPAILLTDDMNTAASSTYCPTFTGLGGVSLIERSGSGVVLEGGEPRAPITRVELWAIANPTFLPPSAP